MRIFHSVQSLPRIAGLFCVVVLGLTQGCATMTEAECVMADWQIVGDNDGAAGEPSTRLADHQKACAKHGITPNRAEYEKGRQRGLQFYCTRDNGYIVGRRGTVYHGVCTGTLRHQFESGYLIGQDIYVAETEVERIRSETDHLKSRIRRLERDKDALNDRIASDDTSSEERKSALNEIKYKDREIYNLRNQLEDVIAHKAIAEYELLRALGRAHGLPFP